MTEQSCNCMDRGMDVFSMNPLKKKILISNKIVDLHVQRLPSILTKDIGVSRSVDKSSPNRLTKSGSFTGYTAT